MRTVFNFIVFLFVFCPLSSCERDDVCLKGTPGTPRLTIRLFDKDNPSQLKPANNISIQGVGQTSQYTTFSTDSISFPLKVNSTSTKYAFILASSTASNTIADTLQFNYTRKDVFISRACGYKATFILSNPAVTTSSTNTVWFDRFEILTNTISDENKANLAIYH